MIADVRELSLPLPVVFFSIDIPAITSQRTDGSVYEMLEKFFAQVAECQRQTCISLVNTGLDAGRLTSSDRRLNKAPGSLSPDLAACFRLALSCARLYTEGR